MKLAPTISMEQKQELVMTPKLQQAIELLQLSRLELNNRLEKELLENPVLELAEDGMEEAEVEEPEDEFEDLDWEDYFVDSSSDYSNYYNQDEDEYNYENFISASLTLEEHLSNQLQMLRLTPKERKIGEYIIGSLDSNGFLDVSVDKLANELQVDRKKVVAILNEIQQFDPVGIAARDLQDSLNIQSEVLTLGKDKGLIKEIIDDYFELLSKNKVKKLAKKLSITPQHSQELVDLIKTLNPCPAKQFEKEGDTKYIEPDLILEKVSGEYIVTMNQSTTSNLRISAYYQKLLKKFKSDTEAKDYLKEKIDSALWLIKSIEQRRMTIYRIAKVIAELQQEFLEKGFKYLRPLTMQDVADEIDMHESTVSRATTQKYIQTPHGLFELKFFFSSGIKAKNGRSLSSVSIKKMIEEIVTNEDVTKPLSDQKIADRLTDLGAEVSRRTVAKYRNELGISSSTKRKRYE
ncbi:RNA polymerase factor sigma-54 [Selenihalanaerobacter shriftii]|uniref:RNA polymerase, sigma 54 subunit, RpoN/SigL n=1 Tax=Selenihalanaerobacter shriftii TaxID=142842 RepID=A0A1T4KGS7_9FIRM|nr:RNA polymerase factor sigma-54 [Selenihalanaerobacter shriftii]SJZ41622.1 RNA polymerase, sigma 54 subunit, RpoN/SigL [Selenihalanaerobacter shriftii]